MNKSENINELAAALSKAQGEFRDAQRTKASYNGKYAELEQVFGIIRPILAKYDLSFVQLPISNSPRELQIETCILHSSGQFISACMTVPVAEGSGKTNSLQQVGVSISYAKRYAIMSMLGICQKDEDDDGDSFAEKPQFNQRAPLKPKEKEPEQKQITPDMLMDLLALINDADGTELKVCEYYKKQKIQELTPAEYEHCLRVMQKKIKDKKGVKETKLNDNS